MNYTIALMEDVQGNIQINLDQSGNEYIVGLYNKDTKEYTYISFKNISNALNRFQDMSQIIILGLYSYEDRKKKLLNKQ